MKLYPPNIEGTIPAFYSTVKGTAKTAVLTVPFSMNQAVNKSAVIGFYLKVKTVQSNEVLFTLKTSEYEISSKYEAYFHLSDEILKKMKIGQFYKVQLAYLSSTEIGYYSTVGIVKYTTMPNLTISNLSANSINMHKYNYTGNYSQVIYNYNIISLDEEDYRPNQYYIEENNEFVLCTAEKKPNVTLFTKIAVTDTKSDDFRDSSEKEYYYRFVMYNKQNQIIADSGMQLHNSSTDLNSFESNDSYAFPSDLTKDTIYYIQYSVITTNNLEVSSPKYRIMQKDSIQPNIDTQLCATLNYDNGYVGLSLKGNLDKETNLETVTSGTFVITRACADDGYKVWHDIMRFTLRGVYPSRQLWKDFTVEQGKYYKYSLQQYNASGLYSARIITDEIFVDFEDAFLYDGERQLKIRYNPKITSFKTDYLETKTDTIGSKFPFIFRNGNVSYKEFPISGLVSYQSDEENLFMTDEELGFIENLDKYTRTATLKDGLDENDNNYFFDIQYNYTSQDIATMKETLKNRRLLGEALDSQRYKTSNLTGVNFSAERAFKLSVMDWLNNGKPKLFRSPAEGNYIIRLMNISFAPEDKLSRMLHTFTGTAYEVAECSYENLNNFNIVSVPEISSIQLLASSIPLSTTEDKEYDERFVQIGSIYYAEGELLPVGKVASTVRFNDMLPGSLVKITQNDIEETIMIGATGSYEINTGSSVSSIIIPAGSYYNGVVTYSYYDDEVVQFNTVSSINIVDVPIAQYIGDSTKSLTKVLSLEEIAELDSSSIWGQEAIENVSNYRIVSYNTNNIIDALENVKMSFDSFYFLHFGLRDVQQAYYNTQDGRLYLDTRHTIAAMENIKDYVYTESGSFDPFLIYKYTKSGGYGYNNRMYYYYKEANKLTSRDFSLGTYYEVNKNGLKKAVVYNATKTYYSLEPLEYYYDPASPDKLIISQDCLNSLLMQATLYGEDLDVMKANIPVYSTEIEINGSYLDIADTGGYFIDHEIKLDSVSIPCGVIAELGYSLQESVYSIESSPELIGRKEKLERYKNVLSAGYRDLVCTSESDNAYGEKLIEVRKNYPIVLEDYLLSLAIRKAKIDEEAKFK